MSDILCSYNDREAALMAYVYDEIAPADRVAFEAHLTTCARCRVELNGLGAVRAQLAEWSAPAYASRKSKAGGRKSVSSRKSEVEGRAGGRAPSAEWRAPSDERRAPSDERASWRNIPVWAQYVAAVLVLGVSVGAANLNIHYDRQTGLTVRTGWSSQGSRDSQGSRGSERAEASGVSRAELTALAQQLRGEIQAVATPVAAHAVTPPSDADTVRRVRALLDDAEKRHERELALKVAEVLRDVNMQRQADLRKIDQNLYALEGKTGVEVLKNRQMIDMYLQRVSQRQ